MASEVLRMEGIDKSFPGVHALKNINLSIHSGEVHAIIGENGAGKSTLMKILSGVHRKDAGEIYIDGKRVDIKLPEQARTLGISIIYQELNLMPNLSIADNIFIGRERRKGPWLDKRETLRLAGEYLRAVGLELDPNTPVKNLSIAQRQMVELAKALSIQAKVIVMDEPSSSLTEHEITILMDRIRKLKEQGTAVVFISHKLNEVFEISDRITVLRDGELIDTLDTANCKEEKLIQMMVGRPLNDLYPKTKLELGETVLEVKQLCSGQEVQDISFSLRQGEILGFTGLVGAGRSELMSALFGIRRMDSGLIKFDGQEFKQGYRSEDMIKAGLGFVPEDRKLQGLILGMSIRENITLSSLEKVSSYGMISKRQENITSEEYIDKLKIKTPSAEQKSENLSGGNQQKVVIGKWLASKPKVLILDEPTRGIDVGAKKEIYQLMGFLAKEGVGILMVSSELPEILGMSDRIIVMNEGHVKGELLREEASQEIILSMILRQESKAIAPSP